MPERATNELLSDALSPARLEVLPPRQVLHLTSWGPQVLQGGQGRHFGAHDLPDRVGLVRAGQSRVLCVGPAEWLLDSDSGPQANGDSPSIGAADDRWVVTDLSAGFSALAVSGSAVRHVLNQGCSLDLDEKIFTP